ncbi:MAG TPA: Rid family hydrolase [Stellaceae bacterium]|nr:Rid family hydrolase [Stellaceae bacterium]
MFAPAEVASKSVERAGGGEHVIAVQPGVRGDFASEQASVAAGYAGALRDLGLTPESAVFRRIFLSDALNQATQLRRGGLVPGPEEDPVAVSRIEQRPLSGAKLALLAYHVTDPAGLAKRRVGPGHLLVEKNGARHLWTTGLCAGVSVGAAAAEAQTRGVFEALIGALAANGASLRQHCVRTWVYVKDIDVFYAGMVNSRRAIFAEQGLTEATHYIASTGIEGACAHRSDLVALDAYSQLDLAPGQLSYLNDLSRLCPTHRYGVTFERGASVSYADRTHLFISGTASIDHNGEVVHRGDVHAQLDRALGNVEALLAAGAGRLDDLLYLIVYLRNPADFPSVRQRLGHRLPGLPVVAVEGPVCRPEWLVEVEGVAVTPRGRPGLPRF